MGMCAMLLQAHMCRSDLAQGSWLTGAPAVGREAFSFCPFVREMTLICLLCGRSRCRRSLWAKQFVFECGF